MRYLPHTQDEVRQMLQRIGVCYGAAALLFLFCSVRAQRAALALAAIHQALLDEIEASHFQVLSRRIALTPMRKLWIAWKTWLRNG